MAKSFLSSTVTCKAGLLIVRGALTYMQDRYDLMAQYLFAYKRLEVRVKQHRVCSFPRSLARSHLALRCEDALQSQ